MHIVKPNRRRWRNQRHHMSNQCHGYRDKLPNGAGENVLMMRPDRHLRLHQMFRNMSWEEIHDTLCDIFGIGDPRLVVKVMARISRAKKRIA